MKRALFVILILLMMSSSASAENLFVMGWDGAGLRNVQKLMEEGKLPSLSEFLKTGGCLTPLEVTTETATVPSWTQVFTGLTYDQTGVLGNKQYNKQLVTAKYRKADHVYWGLNFYIDAIPYEHTIVAAIQAKEYKIGWFASKMHLSKDHSYSPFACIANHADEYLLAPAATEGAAYLDRLAEKALKFIRTQKNYLVFLHVDPDYYGHAHGENSNRYLQEFERADHWFGQILENIDRSNTKVIVMSDHGFDEGGRMHYNAPDAFMATDLPFKQFYCDSETTGTMRDVANTILDYYDVDWKSRIPQMRGKSLLKE